jgi:hypothetical protein
MILGTFVNLIEVGEMENVLSVCGAHRLLENMKQRTWNDEDINTDMNALLDKVSQSMHADLHYFTFILVHICVCLPLEQKACLWPRWLTEILFLTGESQC